jgi:hypothetical protein
MNVGEASEVKNDGEPDEPREGASDEPAGDGDSEGESGS